MAKSKSYKRTMGMIYGLGAAVVILGALFKLMHWSGGSVMLVAGLLTEAAIFTISAFEKPEVDLDWTRVYPQLGADYEAYNYNYNEYVAYQHQAGGNAGGGGGYTSEEQSLISEKLEELFKSANLDTSKLEGLSTSIDNLSAMASNMSEASSAAQNTAQYSEQMAMAASQIKSLNDFYKSQLDQREVQSSVNNQILDVTEKVKNEMELLSSHLASLNGVYGGMLTAMRK